MLDAEVDPGDATADSIDSFWRALEKLPELTSLKMEFYGPFLVGDNEEQGDWALLLRDVTRLTNLR